MQPNRSMLPDAPNPALMAHGHIAVIAAQEDLFSLGDNVTVCINPGVDGGFRTAVADGFDLCDGIGDLHQAAAALEQVALEVGTQAKAQNRYVATIHNGPELVNLAGGHKLAFVHNDHIDGRPAAVELEQVDIGADDLHTRLQADAAAQNVLPVPVIGGGLDQPDFQVIFFVVVFGDQGLGGFGRAHCAIFEIKLRHTDSSNCVNGIIAQLRKNCNEELRGLTGRRGRFSPEKRIAFIGEMVYNKKSVSFPQPAEPRIAQLYIRVWPSW